MTKEIALVHDNFSKVSLANLAINLVGQALENGNILSIAENVAATEFLIKEIKADKRYIDYVREEAGKHGKIYTSEQGTKIELCEVGTKYDFSLCNDPVLHELETSLINFEEAVKQRKEFLKTVPASGLNIITDDGEPVTVYPPSKSSASSFKVTIAK